MVLRRAREMDRRGRELRVDRGRFGIVAGAASIRTLEHCQVDEPHAPGCAGRNPRRCPPIFPKRRSAGETFRSRSCSQNGCGPFASACGIVTASAIALGLGLTTEGGQTVRAGLARLPDKDAIARFMGFGSTRSRSRAQRFTFDGDIFDALDLANAKSAASFDTQAVKSRIERLPWVATAEIHAWLPRPSRYPHQRAAAVRGMAARRNRLPGRQDRARSRCSGCRGAIRSAACFRRRRRERSGEPAGARRELSRHRAPVGRSRACRRAAVDV